MKNLKNVFVLGNGSTRTILNLNRLKGDTIGCNALYRDFRPTYLAVVGPEMYQEVEKAEYTGAILCYNKAKNAGVAALKFASYLAYEHIYMIGFDLKNFINNADCNVYAGSPQYEQYNRFTNFTMSGVVLKEFENIFKEHSKRIIRVIDYDKCWIPYEFMGIKHISYEELMKNDELY